MPVLVACALGVAIGLLALWLSSRAAITIAVVEIAQGHLQVTRGALSPRVLDDLRDIATRPSIASARLRVLRQKDRARVELHGTLSEQQEQRIRNVIGNLPLGQLVKAGRR